MKEDLPTTDEIKIKLVTNDEEVLQILQLQQINLPASISESEMMDQGFVTVQHDPEVLKEMNRVSPGVIAICRQEVVGYALVMPKDFRSKVPILEPMFILIDQLKYLDRPLSSYNYFIMGQVCIAKEFRGKGLFEQLYEGLRNQLSLNYELLITEVSSRNPRSIRAHHRVGLKTIHEYSDPWGQQWQLMVWDWISKYNDEKSGS